MITLYEKSHALPALLDRYENLICEEYGIDGLQDQGRRRNRSPKRKVFEEQKELIIDLGKSRKLGLGRIQSELKSLEDFSLSTTTMHKVLKLDDVKSLRRVRRNKDSDI